MATDLYASIHKAIRYALTGFLVDVGATDPGDDARSVALVERFDGLVELLDKHAQLEEEHVHPLLKRVAPNVLAKLEDSHGGQENDIATLKAALLAVARAPASARGELLARAYRHMASFVTSYFAHLEDEELLAEPALARGFTTDELDATHRALVGSIAPGVTVRFLRFMMPALNVEERVGKLSGMMAAPPAIAEMFLSATEASLTASEWAQVATRLGLGDRDAA